MPCWAFPLLSFREELQSVASGMRLKREDLAKKVIDVCDLFAGMDGVVPTWEVVQRIEEWVFWNLRPALRAVMESEMDGLLN